MSLNDPGYAFRGQILTGWTYCNVTSFVRNPEWEMTVRSVVVVENDTDIIGIVDKSIYMTSEYNQSYHYLILSEPYTSLSEFREGLPGLYRVGA